MLSGKTSPRDLSASHEHYLRAIWEVRTQRGYARLSDVARELKIAPPTLSVGLKPLEARGLVDHDEHRFLLLTPAGERVAREVHHRFAVVRAFLKDVLGVGEDKALHEACLLEHDLSATTTDRMLDLIKLLREDRELREFFQHRFTEYHRSCRVIEECSTCDLACLTPGPRGA
ncbi:MAG TPA: metal-dependent transcriptional regulator [Candidatus Eisenbacteria bacterium]|nr:metal-dependent transcriptional regulator [Candidatus Eisenbacteria bacterium]